MVDDRVDCCGISGVAFEIGLNHLCALDEKRDGCVVSQRRHGIDSFRLKMELFAAGGNDRDARTGRQKFGDPACRGRQVFEVVKHEEQVARAKVSFDRVAGRSFCRVAKTERSRDRRCDERRLRNRCEFGHHGPTLEARGGFGRSPDCQARLPDAGRPNERNEPCVVSPNERDQTLEVRVSPDEDGRSRQGRRRFGASVAIGRLARGVLQSRSLVGGKPKRFGEQHDRDEPGRRSGAGFDIAYGARREARTLGEGLL